MTVTSITKDLYEREANDALQAYVRWTAYLCLSYFGCFHVVALWLMD